MISNFNAIVFMAIGIASYILAFEVFHDPEERHGVKWVFIIGLCINGIFWTAMVLDHFYQKLF